MRRQRKTYQFGWLERQERKGRPAMWLYRYREMTAQGDFRKRCITVGSLEEYPTEALAWRRPSICGYAPIPTRHPGIR